MTPRWRWRRKRMGRGRPFRHLYLSNIPNAKEFFPRPGRNRPPIELTYPEYEALKLTDLDGLKQEEVAARMKTSRGTVWRLLESAHKKVAQALSESRPLFISPKGEVEKV